MVEEYTETTMIQGNLDKGRDYVKVKGEDTVLVVDGFVNCGSLSVESGAELRVTGGVNEGTLEVKENATAIIDGTVNSHFVNVYENGSLFVNGNIPNEINVSKEGEVMVSGYVEEAHTDYESKLHAGGTLTTTGGDEDSMKSGDPNARSKVENKIRETTFSV
jgi:hypothetical protein